MEFSAFLDDVSCCANVVNSSAEQENQVFPMNARTHTQNHAPCKFNMELKGFAALVARPGGWGI